MFSSSFPGCSQSPGPDDAFSDVTSLFVPSPIAQITTASLYTRMNAGVHGAHRGSLSPLPRSSAPRGSYITVHLFPSPPNVSPPLQSELMPSCCLWSFVQYPPLLSSLLCDFISSHLCDIFSSHPGHNSPPSLYYWRLETVVIIINPFPLYMILINALS